MSQESWTRDEDDVILVGVYMGQSYRQISKSLDGRTAQDCRQRHEKLQQLGSEDEEDHIENEKDVDYEPTLNKKKPCKRKKKNVGTKSINNNKEKKIKSKPTKLKKNSRKRKLSGCNDERKRPSKKAKANPSSTNKVIDQNQNESVNNEIGWIPSGELEILSWLTIKVEEFGKYVDVVKPYFIDHEVNCVEALKCLDLEDLHKFGIKSILVKKKLLKEIKTL